eukprot:1173-Chlamydomonas_euryale.AAC.1
MRLAARVHRRAVRSREPAVDGLDLEADSTIGALAVLRGVIGNGHHTRYRACRATPCHNLPHLPITCHTWPCQVQPPNRRAQGATTQPPCAGCNCLSAVRRTNSLQKNTP